MPSRKLKDFLEIPKEITLSDFVKGSCLYTGIWTFYWNKSIVLYRSDLRDKQWALMSQADATLLLHAPRNYELTQKHVWYKTRKEAVACNQEFLMHQLYQGAHVKKIPELRKQIEDTQNLPLSKRTTFNKEVILSKKNAVNW